MSKLTEGYVHLLRFALEGRPQDAIALARKHLKDINEVDPEVGKELKKVLLKYNVKQSATRDVNMLPLPIDIDSKLELLKREDFVESIDIVWSDEIMKELKAIVDERSFEAELLENGLSPTRSVLFVGPPGVGKTMAAQWLSHYLERPLLTLDLASVMSSYLGKTGNNVRAVLNYSQKNRCVLLLDEFDSIAKKRNDDSELGELKRLVTVLLQSIDQWPSTGLLIAATNHPELLDPAVWRRFERIIYFPFPSPQEIKTTIKDLLNDVTSIEENLIDALSIVLEGKSYAEVTRLINIVRREKIVHKKSFLILLEELLSNECKNLNKDKKIAVAKKISQIGLSQRRISELIGVSRDTLRKYIKPTLG